jgi:hypothetical protein
VVSAAWDRFRLLPTWARWGTVIAIVAAADAAAVLRENSSSSPSGAGAAWPSAGVVNDSFQRELLRAETSASAYPVRVGTASCQPSQAQPSSTAESWNWRCRADVYLGGVTAPLSAYDLSVESNGCWTGLLIAFEKNARDAMTPSQVLRQYRSSGQSTQDLRLNGCTRYQTATAPSTTPSSAESARSLADRLPRGDGIGPVTLGDSASSVVAALGSQGQRAIGFQGVTTWDVPGGQLFVALSQGKASAIWTNSPYFKYRGLSVASGFDELRRALPGWHSAVCGPGEQLSLSGSPNGSSTEWLFNPRPASSDPTKYPLARVTAGPPTTFCEGV